MVGSPKKPKPKVYAVPGRHYTAMFRSLNYLIGLVQQCRILLNQFFSIKQLGFNSSRLQQNQSGFITMIIMILTVLAVVIGFVFLRVLKANH